MFRSYGQGRPYGATRSAPTGRTHSKAMPSTPEGVKKFRTGRDREGEAPAEPHGARTSGAMARQEARPPNFFTTSPGGIFTGDSYDRERTKQG